MGRHAAALIVSVLAVWWPSTGAAATRADEAAEMADVATTPAWSASEIERHINALDAIRDPQTRANEFLRILLATMSVRDPLVRATLLEHLRPHFAPLSSATAIGTVPADDGATDAPPVR